jgi:hypothetical protein
MVSLRNLSVKSEVLQSGKDHHQRLVRERGFEPPRFLGHKILSLARLPVPPLPHEEIMHCHFTPKRSKFFAAMRQKSSGRRSQFAGSLSFSPRQAQTSPKQRDCRL